MEKPFSFTEAKIRALKPPAGDNRNTRAWYRDARVKDLHLAVFASGAKSYYLYKWTDGKPVRTKLGTTTELSVDDARKKAQKLLGQVADGRNPHAEKQAKLHGQTLAALWDEYLERHAKPQKKSWQDDVRMYEKYMTDLAGMKLSAITREVVLKWHSDLGKTSGKIQANRCLALLATIYSKGGKFSTYAGTNPCIGVDKFPEKSRERYLLPAEMEAFFRALAKEDAYWQAFFLLCLFTGARRGNVASMAWAEIDLINGVWQIPASKTKNQQPSALALCEPALAILKARYADRQSREWVFPAFRGSGCLCDPRKSWDRILLAMRRCPECDEQVGEGELIGKPTWPNNRKKWKCPKCRADLSPAKPIDLRMHDLRRTQGSWQAALGISLAIIGKSLGHADLKSTQTYSRLQLDPVRDAVGRATASMTGAAGVTIGTDGALVLDVTTKE